MADKDGVYVEDDFLGGAREVPPPVPVQAPPAMELIATDDQVFIEPYAGSTQPIRRTQQFVLRQRTAEGVIEKRGRRDFLTHGSDGKIINPETYRRCPVTNAVYKAPGIVCKVCRREVYPPAIVPTRLDPKQEACVRCVHLYRL